MPNAAIPTNIRNMISQYANRLAERVLSYSMMNFPIPASELEARINNPETLDMIRALDARGVEQATAEDINLCLHHSMIPGLKRGIIIRMSNLPQPIFVPRRGVYGHVYNFNWADLSDKHNAHAAFVPNLDGLDEEQLKALATWANNAIYNQRLCNLVREVVDDALMVTHSHTVGHLHAWWPILTTMVDAGEKTWVERMRNPPRRNLNIYAPKDPAEHAKYAKRRELAEQMFAKANLLPPYKHPTGTPKAMIIKIEKLAGDTFL